MLRLALVGCGRHSETGHAAPLARYAKEHPGQVALAAACDLRLERAEEFCNGFGFAKAYADVKEMLDEEKPDACVCVMPVAKIAATATVLLRAEIPCTVEKPPGASLDEVRGLARVARETGTPHMVSVNRRFIPRLNRAISWAREQGEVRYVRGAMLRHRRAEPSFLWGTAIHAVDAMRHIAGELKEYDAGAVKGPGLSTRWCGISFRFKTGCLGRLDILPTCGMVEETYELFGEGFRARVSCEAATGEQARGMTLECWKGGELVLRDAAPPDEPADVLSGFYGEAEEFVSALSEGRPPRPSVEDILPSAEICSAVAGQAGIPAGKTSLDAGPEDSNDRRQR